MKKRFILVCLLGALSTLIACNLDNIHNTENSSTDVEDKKAAGSDSNTAETSNQGLGDNVTKITSDIDDENITNEQLNNPDVVIKDDTFITQMDQVFINLDSYVGKTMRVEGFIGPVSGNSFDILRLYDMPHEDHSHENAVGVNAVYDGEIPPEDTWVEITGVIQKGTVNGSEEPVIKVKRLEKKFTDGQKKVYN